jgi:hypothetical protein
VSSELRAICEATRQREHLGDGAYIGLGEGEIWLWADREEGIHAVCLDGYAVKHLLEWLNARGIALKP